MGKYLDELKFKPEADVITKPLEGPIEITPRLHFEVPRQHFFIEEQKKMVKKQAEDELVRLRTELETSQKELEEMPVKIAPEIAERLILPGTKRIRWELYKLLGKEELESRATRKENLRSKIHNYELAAETHQTFLDNMEVDPSFFNEVRRGVEETLRDPVKLIPFYGSIKSLEELTDAITAADKLKKDLPLNDYEEGLVERYKAMNLPIPSNIGYGVGTLLASMPTYIAEWGGLKTLVAEPVKRIVGEKVGAGVLGRITSQTISMLAHGISNVPEIAERTALNLIPNYEELRSPIYQELYGSLGKEVSFEKALVRAVGSTAVDYITEYAGVLIEKPMSFVSEAVLGKWVAKLGLTQSVDAISDLAKKVGWHGIVAEVFEEELAELAQAPIGEREYYAPFVTPEGTERLFTEILGIGAFAGLAGVSLGTINQVSRLRTKPKIELPPELPKPEEFYKISKEPIVKPEVKLKISKVALKEFELLAEKAKRHKTLDGFLADRKIDYLIKRTDPNSLTHATELEKAVGILKDGKIKAFPPQEGLMPAVSFSRKKFFGVFSLDPVKIIYDRSELIKQVGKPKPFGEVIEEAEERIIKKDVSLVGVKKIEIYPIWEGYQLKITPEIKTKIDYNKQLRKEIVSLAEKRGIPVLVVDDEGLTEFYQSVTGKVSPTLDISILKDKAQKAAQQGNMRELLNTTKEWIETVPDIKPYALWEEEKKQTAYLKLFTTGVPSSKLGKLKQLAKEFSRSGFALVEPMGKWGKELVASAKEIEQSSRQTSAKQLKELQKAGIEKLTHEEKLSVVATIEDLPKVPVRNERVDRVVEAHKKIVGEIGAVAEEMNVMIKTRSGDTYTFVARPNYFSHWVRPQQLIRNPKYAKRVIKDSVSVGKFGTKKEAQSYYDSYVSFYKTQGKDTAFVSKFMEDNPKLTFGQATAILKKYILPSVPRRMGKLEKAREVDFRLYDMDYTRVTSEFLPSVWKRINEIKYWGQNYEGADVLIALMGQDGYDGLLAKMVFDTATNRGAVIDIRTNLLRDGEQAILEIQTLKLALSQLMQVIQAANHTALVGWQGSLAGLSKAFTEQGKDFADEVGLVYLESYEQALAEVGEEGFGSKVLRTTGFTFLDRFVRKWAINSAPFLLKDAIKNKDQLWAKKILGDFLVSKERVKSVLDKGYATEEESKFFSGNLERVTNFLYKRGWDLPPRWEHLKQVPLFKTMLQFKSFQTQQSEFVMKYIVDIIKLQPEKGLANLFSWLLFTTITGASIETIRRAIRGRRLPEDFLGYLKMGIQTGMLGIFADMVESASYYGGFLRWGAGPFFGDVGEFMYDVAHTKFRKGFDTALSYLLFTVPLTPEQIAILNLLYQPVRKRLIVPYQ